MRYFLPLIALFLLFSPVIAEEVEVRGFTFDCPFPETEFKKLGAEASSATWPAEATFEDAAVQMIVASFDAESAKMISEGGGSLYQYALSTYMAIYGKPESINKTLFFGGTSARKQYNSSVPRKHVAHVYAKPLKGGGYVMVGVRVFKPKELKYGDLLRAVANTFQVKE